MKNFIRLIKSVLLCTLIVVCICGCGKNTAQYISSETVNTTEDTQSESQTLALDTQYSETDADPQLLYVYVCGAVYQPGVYTFLEGARVCDLFEAAGGLTEDAATDYWNQARVLVDGEMYYVPTMQEAQERQLSGLDVSSNNSSGSENTDDTNGKINLNTASLEQLMEIPGIGESKAKAILNYRETNGGFSSIEEVMNIEGIKEGVFSKMKEYIVVN